MVKVQNKHKWHDSFVVLTSKWCLEIVIIEISAVIIEN